MPKNTKQELLDCAEHAARTRGWDGFSYADLANEVGIRKASIHYYFPAKADLSDALMERYAQNMQSACDAIDDAHSTGSDRLKAMVNHYRHALNGGETVCLCVALSTSRESLPDSVTARIIAFREKTTEWLSSAFQFGMADNSISNVVEPRQEASAALALLEGAHLAARSAFDTRSFDEAVVILEERCREM